MHRRAVSFRCVAAAGVLASCGAALGVNPAQIAPADVASFDESGSSVAVMGDWLLVGSREDDNVEGVDAGSVYTFRSVNGAWQQQQVLRPSAIDATDWLGGQVALGLPDASGQPAFGLMSAPNADNGGRVWLLTRSGNTWTPTALSHPALAPGARFGESLAIGGQWAMAGLPLADVGANTDAGRVGLGVYDAQSNTWLPGMSNIVAPDGQLGDFFGTSVACNDLVAVAGAPGRNIGPATNAGAFYAYGPGIWQWTRFDHPEPELGAGFGQAIGVDSEGWVIIGAPDQDGESGPDAGAVYIFRRDVQNGVASFIPHQVFEGTTLHFGRGLSVSGRAFVAADDQGWVSLFTFDEGTQAYKLETYHHVPGAGSPAVGRAISFDDQTVASGDPHASFNGMAEAGRTVVWSPGAGADHCAGATAGDASVNAYVANASNRFAGTDGSASCAASGADQWYRVLVGEGHYEINVLSGSFDPVLTVFDACPGEGGVEIGCDDDSGEGAQSMLAIDFIQPTEVVVRVAGFAGARGDYTLIVERINVTCPPDLNGDGVVNSTDLNLVLAEFGQDSGGDTDGDGDTDSIDLNAVLAAFGQACP